MLRAVRNILHGPLPEKWAALADADNGWRKLPFAVLLASLLVFGFFPRLLTEKIMPSAEVIVSMATSKAGKQAVMNSPMNGLLALPHPSPLPHGRENPLLSPSISSVGKKLHDSEAKENGRVRSALLGGEGQGEGESGGTAQPSQNRLTSAVTK
jgi:hypothetical protein